MGDNNDKTPIEIALQIDNDGYTTAKKLYAWLYGNNGSHYAKWAKQNIVDNPFVSENEFSPILRKPSKKGGRPTQDYKITASLAKKISMTEKTSRGEQARQYFLGCEQALKLIVESNRRTEIERAKGIAVRQALTKAIQQSTENDRMHGHAYSTYTNVIYKSIFGKDAKKLREEFGITKQSELRDCLSEESLNKIRRAEMLVSSLIEYGWGYREIKDFILNESINKIEAD